MTKKNKKSIKSTDFEKKWKRVESIIVGLWRFRNSTKIKQEWSVTWTYRGNYYDTYPKDTPEKALDALYRNWCKVKKRCVKRVKRTAT